MREHNALGVSRCAGSIYQNGKVVRSGGGGFGSGGGSFGLCRSSGCLNSGGGSPGHGRIRPFFHHLIAGDGFERVDIDDQRQGREGLGAEFFVAFCADKQCLSLRMGEDVGDYGRREVRQKRHRYPAECCRAEKSCNPVGMACGKDGDLVT